MIKVCPRCRYPQNGVDECEYCGLVFDQSNRTKNPQKSFRQNTVDKQTGGLNAILSLAAIAAFCGLVYFWYQHESAKKMAEIETKSKVKTIEQGKIDNPQPFKINKKQPNPEIVLKKSSVPIQKIQEAVFVPNTDEPKTTDKKQDQGIRAAKRALKTPPWVITSEQQLIESKEETVASSEKKTEKKNPPVITKVFCSRFNVNTVLIGREIQFWLDTDLPGDTIVMVNVSRPYWVKGRPGTYFGSYYGNWSTVQELRNPETIILDDNEWKSQVEQKHSLTKPIGEPLQLSKISDEVELYIAVPINQNNPAFGRRNANLEGPMVRADHGFKIIKEEKMFTVPFWQTKSMGWQPRAQKQPHFEVIR